VHCRSVCPVRAGWYGMPVRLLGRPPSPHESVIKYELTVRPKHDLLGDNGNLEADNGGTITTYPLVLKPQPIENFLKECTG